MRRPIAETFICPTPLGHYRTTLPARIVNACRLLLSRSADGHVFLPIRSMQFQAIISTGEVLFVDHQGGYALEQGVGGRLVALDWRFSDSGRWPSLSAPAAATLTCYRDDAIELHRRILSELPPVLESRLEASRQPDTDRSVVLSGPGVGSGSRDHPLPLLDTN